MNEPDGYSYATTVRITGQAWDGAKWPYANDNTAQLAQFGTVKRVEIQPPGSTDWFYASDVSGANGEITMETHPFKDWVYEWDGAAHPEGEGDITFRIRSYDGLDYSPVEVRQYKLNLVAPTLLVDVPTQGSLHTNGKVLFQGTASDPYQGTYGSDVKQIWFKIVGPGTTQSFFQQGSTSWSYEWNVAELPRVNTPSKSGLPTATSASVKQRPQRVALRKHERSPSTTTTFHPTSSFRGLERKISPAAASTAARCWPSWTTPKSWVSLATSEAL